MSQDERTPITTPAERVPDLPSLETALLNAQIEADNVDFDAKHHQGYPYTKAESVIHLAQQALNNNGLTVRTISVELNKERQIVKIKRLLCCGTERDEFEMEWPIAEQNRGRSYMQCVAHALTNSLSYFLRDLLLISRGFEKDDMNLDPPMREPSNLRRSSRQPKSGSPYNAPPLSLEEKIRKGFEQLVVLDTTKDENEELKELGNGGYTQAVYDRLQEMYREVRRRKGAQAP